VKRLEVARSFTWTHLDKPDLCKPHVAASSKHMNQGDNAETHWRWQKVRSCAPKNRRWAGNCYSAHPIQCTSTCCPLVFDNPCDGSSRHRSCPAGDPYCRNRDDLQSVSSISTHLDRDLRSDADMSDQDTDHAAVQSHWLQIAKSFMMHSFAEAETSANRPQTANHAYLYQRTSLIASYTIADSGSGRGMARLPPSTNHTQM